MKLTITTLVIVEGSYIQGIFHSLEELLYHCPILWMGTKRGRPRGNHFPYILFFDIHVDDAIYEVLTMPREEITI